MRIVMAVAALVGSVAGADEGHDKFTILELKIGLPVEQAGYTCQKPAGKDAEQRHCVKFMDPRCEGKRTNIGALRYGEVAPPGCFLDHSSAATYLDGKLMQTPNTNDSSDKRPILKPLLHMELVGTVSKPSKIFRLSYVVAPDELTEDSKLYGALAAKYGEPTDKRPPNDMRWKLGDATLRATCLPKRNCQIVVEDMKFEELQRRWQEDADAQQRHKAAPEAPKL